MREARGIFQNIYLGEATTEEKVNAIRKVVGMETHNSFTKQEFINALDWLLNEQPKNNGWILCSEKLPEEKECEKPVYDAITLADVDVERYMASDLVNVTAKHYDSDEVFVSDDMTVDGKWVNFNGEDYEVIAWQPLPAPYQQKEEE